MFAPDRLKITKTLLCIAIQAMTASASALSCKPLSYEWLYDKANEVFLAQMVSQEIIGEPPDDPQFDTRRVNNGFRVLETFKGKVDYDAFMTDLQWSSNVAHFTIGQKNLFFMGETPGFGDCSPTLNPDQPMVQQLMHRLREVRDGFIDTFDGAWQANSSEPVCRLSSHYLIDSNNDQSLLVAVNFTHSSDADDGESELGIQVRTWGLSVGNQANAPSLWLDGKETRFNFEKKSQYAQGRYVVTLTNSAALLQGILDDKEPALELLLPRPEELALRLNGGSPAILEYAQCSETTLPPEFE